MPMESATVCVMSSGDEKKMHLTVSVKLIKDMHVNRNWYSIRIERGRIVCLELTHLFASSRFHGF